jgi:hypothetical protein
LHSPPLMKHFLSQSLYFWGTKFTSIFSMYLDSTIH